MPDTTLKTRFAPSPTGHLHVGGARTALFSYLHAKQNDGTFVLRIEDTDRARHDESAVGKIIEDMRWLGLHWDEGIEVGGDNGPYRQSERLETYGKYIDRLLTEGKAYYAFDTPEELQAMREKAQAEKTNFHYPRPDPLPTEADVEKARFEGRPVVVRFKVPGRDVTIHDEAFGDVTTPAAEQEDFIIRKADGYPTFYLANVVDDALMGVTMVMRGQEFLGQTWRQSLLREALGFEEPNFLHLPLIMDMKGRKLSKRDGDVDVFSFRKAGYLPEVLISFIALLGWNPGTDRELFEMGELIESFSPQRVGKSNAKFDRDKLLAFNTNAVAAASEDRLLEAFKDFLIINDSPIPADDDELLRHLLRANKGFRTFPDIIAKSGILFADDSAIEYDAKAMKKVMRKNEGQAYDVLADFRPRLEQCEWTEKALEDLIRTYCEEKELGMGKVAQPLRVALTGTQVSPGIGDTLVLAGKDTTLRRIDKLLAEKE
ncbi:MAG: glutamate--tRNA ligase [Phycisphaerae bacterium]